MDELNIVDQVQLVQQNRADQAIHIAAGDKAKSVGHAWSPKFHQFGIWDVLDKA
ncbi:MAG: hypothetical protein V9G98_12555 [Candidatus Competibacter sp.]